MAKHYKVNLKIGARSVQLKLFSNSLDNLLIFCDTYLEGKVVEVSELIYEAPSNALIPIDDKSLYHPVTYINCRDKTANISRVVNLHLIKKSKSLDQVFEGMKTLLKLGITHNIDAHMGIKQSMK